MTKSKPIVLKVFKVQQTTLLVQKMAFNTPLIKQSFPIKQSFAVVSLIERLKLLHKAHLFSMCLDLTMGLLPLKDFLPNECTPEMNR